MWHEIRKQERKIRCMIVDYKRRAERRRDYYEKIKADPTQFLQIHGRSCKVHLDPQVAAAGDSPAVMMGWQGSQDVIIDRFDVRAHLDYIQEHKSSSDDNLSYDERLVNYERYRILVQNDFLGVSEEKFLHQIYLEEQFGAVKSEPQPLEGKKKVPGAAIGYNYDDPMADVPQPSPPASTEPESEAIPEEDEEDDSDIDFDMCVDVNKVSTQQAHELNNCGHGYGMDGNDFFSFLTKDKEEADNLRIAKELEEEKAMYSGRKSRRERRAYRDKKLAGRKISPPSYASRKSPTYRDYGELSRSRSKSASPVNSGKITYITSFSVEEQVQQGPSSPKQSRGYSEDRRSVTYKSRTPDSRRHRSYRSRSRSRSPERIGRDRRRSRSRSRSPERIGRDRDRRRSRSRSRSAERSGGGRDRDRRRSRSRSRSRERRRSSRSRSAERSSGRDRRRSRSRSRSLSTSSRGRHRRRSRSPQPSKSSWSSNYREQNKSKSKSKSPPRIVKSDSKPVFNPSAPAKQPPPPIISRYYGRRGQSSSSELSLSDDDDKNSRDSYKSSSHKKPWSDFGNSSGRNKVTWTKLVEFSAQNNSSRAA